MIGRLQGALAAKQAPDLLVDINGVGYEVQAPMSTFAAIGKVGDPVTLYTHLAIRDDAHQLYGFADQGERSLFKTLIKVSGVGPKLALAILSGMDVNAFAQCVHQEDIASLTKLPGVGKKTAERLIIELRDKLSSATSGPSSVSVVGGAAPISDDAQAALQGLGYKPSEAEKLVAAALKDGAYTRSEDLIKAALKQVTR